jgi:hypothetical protein
MLSRSPSKARELSILHPIGRNKRRRQTPLDYTRLVDAEMTNRIKNDQQNPVGMLSRSPSNARELSILHVIGRNKRRRQTPLDYTRHVDAEMTNRIKTTNRNLLVCYHAPQAMLGSLAYFIQLDETNAGGKLRYTTPETLMPRRPTDS